MNAMELRCGVIISILGVASLCACQGAPLPDDASDAEKREAIASMYREYKEAFPDVPDLTPEQAVKLHEDEGAVIVDVRTPEEQAVSRIPGAITARAFEANEDTYRDHPVVTYCTIGARSGEYARDLREQGWDARNLRGSILAWTHAQQPLEDPRGEPTKRVHVYGATWNLVAEGYTAEW